MGTTVSAVIEPLVERRVFVTEAEAVQEMARDYVLRQITTLQQQIKRFERKYGMSFRRFNDYLHARSEMLTAGSLVDEERRTLGRAIMQEEDDWLDWKAAQEMLDSWLGLRAVG